jgi:hypothetical protein
MPIEIRLAALLAFAPAVALADDQAAPGGLPLALLTTVSAVVVAIAGFAAVALAKYISAHTKNAAVRGLLLRLDDVVYAVVKELNQTVVDAARAKSEDGTLSSQAVAEVKGAAVAKVKSYFGIEGFALVSKVLGLAEPQATSFVASRIEAAVHDVKLQKSAVAGPLDPQKAASA